MSPKKKPTKPVPRYLVSATVPPATLWILTLESERRGLTLTDMVVRALAEWASEPHAEPSEAVVRRAWKRMPPGSS